MLSEITPFGQPRIDAEVAISAKHIALAGFTGVGKPNGESTETIPLLMAVGLSNAWGIPLTTWVWARTFLVLIPSPSICQFVDHPGADKLNGRPLVHRLSSKTGRSA